MRSKHIFLIALTTNIVTVAIAVTAAVTRTDHRHQPVEEVVRHLCGASKIAMHDDRIAFESDAPAQREEALPRFYAGTALYHSAYSLAYCLDAKDLPEAPTSCLINRDWPCLAKIAGTIEARIP